MDPHSKLIQTRRFAPQIQRSPAERESPIKCTHLAALWRGQPSRGKSWVLTSGIYTVHLLEPDTLNAVRLGRQLSIIGTAFITLHLFLLFLSVRLSAAGRIGLRAAALLARQAFRLRCDKAPLR